jgi:protein-disulfide isomerase
MASRSEDSQADPGTANRRTALLRLGLLLALAAVVVIVAIVLSSSGDSKSSSASRSTGGGDDAAQVAALFKGVPQSGVTLGDPKSKVTLLEFADLQCPFCAEYSNQALPTVVDKYVRTGRLKYQLRLVGILGDESVKAAGAAAAVTKENKLYQFADLFYRRQKQENTGYVTDAFLTDVAKGVGADPAAALAASKAPLQQPLVRAAVQQSSDLGSGGTPDFYVKLASGRFVPVAPQDLTAEAFTQALDKALAQT